MISILALGLLIGMQHALEADHVAAVSAIAAKQTSRRKIISHGVFWGLGHTCTLMLLAGGVFLLGAEISDYASNFMEFCVGILLVLLGGNLLGQLIRDRVHFHFHKHNDGKVHLHAHSHAGEVGEHKAMSHDHEHAAGIPWRTLLVGMMHGMAGSAALLILTTQAVSSPLQGLFYIILFGFGSVVGMAILSAIISVPLHFSARFLTWANRGIQGAIGVWTVALGGFVLYGTYPQVLS